jgi:hypothetical protein
MKLRYVRFANERTMINRKSQPFVQVGTEGVTDINMSNGVVTVTCKDGPEPVTVLPWSQVAHAHPIAEEIVKKG